MTTLYLTLHGSPGMCQNPFRPKRCKTFYTMRYISSACILPKSGLTRKWNRPRTRAHSSTMPASSTGSGSTGRLALVVVLILCGLVYYRDASYATQLQAAQQEAAAKAAAAAATNSAVPPSTHSPSGTTKAHHGSHTHLTQSHTPLPLPWYSLELCCVVCHRSNCCGWRVQRC